MSGALIEVDPNQKNRADAQEAPGAAEKCCRLMRLEIADGRAGKETDAGHRRHRRRQLGRRREIGDDRMNGKVGEIAPQLRRILLQKIAGNVDRDIGLDRRRGAEQDARFAARAAAELDQRAARREERSHGRRILVQQRKLAARRIIFRQAGDLLEQRRPGQIIEIFGRQPFWFRGKAADDIGGEPFGRLGRRRRSQRGLQTPRHRTAQRSNSARRSPLNCQRAEG